MPKLVNHAERRTTIVEAAWRLIAERGIDGVNMRDLAAAAGYTNGALSHYFGGKDEILRSAFEHVLVETNRRIDASVGSSHGRAALRKVCFEIMPLTSSAALEARIAVSLWQRAMNDPVMKRINNDAVGQWKAIMRRHWTEAIAAHELPPTDVDRGVELLMTAIIGLQITAVLDSDAASRGAQVALLDRILAAEGRCG
ncbi:TetR/AcrR family transcriptional regulator [Gordonia sp. TBRC 11910]|uniref:TetR/AcrR family transcriptional regulator n=1 Tax=Gordonia asplenii TaxID=2725283 RepID=A0A848L1S3_9ACTN|nr:TetR/AcrR family transcriptional regulator [Gordonia asplenii]